MSEYTVVVGVANPENIEALISTGCLMANERGGRVIATTVIRVDVPEPPSASQPLGRMTRADDVLDLAGTIARRLGTRCECRLAVGRGVAEVLNEVAEAEDAEAIVVGFSERLHPRSVDSGFERLVDEIAAETRCDLVIARFRGEDCYRRVMVPVQSRQDLHLCSELVSAMHNQLGADVEVVHFAESASEVEAMCGTLEHWLSELGFSEWMHPGVHVGKDPAQAIIAASTGYDAILLGSAPLHEVRRKLFGTVSEHVANHAHCTTFLIRASHVCVQP